MFNKLTCPNCKISIKMSFMVKVEGSNGKKKLIDVEKEEVVILPCNHQFVLSQLYSLNEAMFSYSFAYERVAFKPARRTAGRTIRSLSSIDIGRIPTPITNYYFATAGTASAEVQPVVVQENNNNNG